MEKQNKIKKSFDDYKEYKSSFLYSQIHAMMILTGGITLYAFLAPILIYLLVSSVYMPSIHLEFGILATSCLIPFMGFVIIYTNKKISDRIKGVIYEMLMMLVFVSGVIVYPNLALYHSWQLGEYADYTIYFIISLIILLIFVIHPIHFLVSYGIATGLIIYSVILLEPNDIKQVYNLAIFCIVTMILYTLKYRARLRSYHKSIQIEEMQKNKEKFLVSLTHEMRTPLNAVLGKNQMILADTREEETRMLARQINGSGRMLLSLINDILDQSKLESGKMSLIESEYQPYVMTADLISIMHTMAEEHGLEFVEDISEEIPKYLIGDEIRIKQIILNLLSNAIKYTKNGSVTLKVDFERKNNSHGMLNVSVTDTGVGIREEDIPKLTEAFTRIDEEKNKHIQGTGLGLSITSQLLSMMGSKLEVQSKYGSGSTFSFSVRQEILEKEDAVSSDSKTKSYPDAKILVVDDNKVNNSVIKGLLKKNSIVSDYAPGGKDCLEMVAEKTYDIIFLDHMMPEMDGVETLSRLKSYYPDRLEGTAIIALTANYDSNAQTFYESLGFDGYLAKPVDVDKLNILLNLYLNKQ